MLEFLGVDLETIDQDAAGAAAVDDDHLAVVELHLAMEPRNARIAAEGVGRVLMPAHLVAAAFTEDQDLSRLGTSDDDELSRAHGNLGHVEMRAMMMIWNGKRFVIRE